MDEKPETSSTSAEQGELMTLVELQKFLADELASSDSTSTFQRAFLPLTDGLGLESPRSRETVFVTPKPEPKVTEPIPKAPPIPTVRKAILDGMAFEPKLPKPNPLTAASTSTRVKDREPTILEIDDDLPPVDSLLKPKAKTPVLAPEPEPEPPEAVPVPPPMPVASFFRRAQAALVDHAFVVVLWAGALVITSKGLALSAEPLLTRILHDFANPLFIRFAILEFCTLWFCYLALCIGLLDVTFGMWVWGLRLSYGAGSRGFGKLKRIFFSLLLVAPVFPSLLLVFRAHGRNLLDWLSSSRVYRATV